jgi:hypothetical protein
VFGFALENAQHQRVLAMTTEWDGERTGAFNAGETVYVALSFDNWFAPGRYGVTVQVTTPRGERVLANVEQAATVAVTGARTGGGAVDVPHRFHVRRSERAAPQAPTPAPS